MRGYVPGETVKIVGPFSIGNVGTIISGEDSRGRYLVRITERMQTYYSADDLETLRARRQRHEGAGDEPSADDMQPAAG
jgi:hypothetical protein